MQATSEYQEAIGFASTYRYRHTPEGQPTVADLVQRGMTIRSSYDTGGIVLRVSGPFDYTSADGERLQHFTITYVEPKHWTDKTPEHHASWINELVAVDGRLLKLFEANGDEVFITNRDVLPGENKVGQMSFF